MTKEFTHQLIEGFQFSNKGQFEQAEIVVVSAPKSQEFYGNLAYLDSLYIKSQNRTMKDLSGLLNDLDDDKIKKIQEQEQAKKEEAGGETDEDTALKVYSQLISGLTQQEIKQLDICICELLKTSAMVNGDKKFEAVFFENDLCFEDRRVLTGKYVLNFTSSGQKVLKRA